MPEAIKDICSMIQTIFSVIGVIVAVIGVVIAVCIPVWIMHNQRYENLLQAYMANDFAEAVKGVTDFFKNDCNSDVNQIADAYKKRFEDDFKKSDKNLGVKTASQILHYQRRLLNNFFWGLNSCAKDPFLKHKVKNEFSRNEAYICKILIYMNTVSDSDGEVFKDISEIKYEPMPKTKGMSSALNNIYEILKDQSRWIK